MANFEITSSDPIAKLIVLEIFSKKVNSARAAEALYNKCKYQICEANGFDWEAEGFDDMFWEVFNDAHQA
tara:strand:- start:129 stop:338 length:210 start_codon:yes stop_codon:yes gene_type:complete